MKCSPTVTAGAHFSDYFNMYEASILRVNHTRVDCMDAICRPATKQNDSPENQQMGYSCNQAAGFAFIIPTGNQNYLSSLALI